MIDSYIRKATVTNVVDGDTIDAIVDLGYRITTVQRFRLLGVDTPEKGEDGWSDATSFTREKLLGKDVYIKSEKSDSFGRFLATIYLDEGDYFTFNDLLLVKGLAVPYRK